MESEFFLQWTDYRVSDKVMWRRLILGSYSGASPYIVVRGLDHQTVPRLPHQETPISAEEWGLKIATITRQTWSHQGGGTMTMTMRQPSIIPTKSPIDDKKHDRSRHRRREFNLSVLISDSAILQYCGIWDQNRQVASEIWDTKVSWNLRSKRKSRISRRNVAAKMWPC